MHLNTKIRTVILGAGQIAGGYDTPDSAMILTHAHALSCNPGFDTLGVFDPNSEKLELMAKKWKLNAFTSIEEVKEANADLVIICTPDNTHAELLNEVLNWNPRAVVCEKPLTENSQQTEMIIGDYAKAEVPLFVNFQRRFDKSVNNLKTRYEEGQLGNILNVSIKYSKGLRHNGSHALDLLFYFFGAPERFIKLREVVDYSPNDPTVDCVLIYKDHVVHMMAGNEQAFSVFEIDFMFTKGRFRFHHSGLRVEESSVEPDPVFPNYYELSSKPSVDSELKVSMKNFYQELYMYLVTGENKVSSNANATLICQKLAEEIIGAKI